MSLALLCAQAALPLTMAAAQAFLPQAVPLADAPAFILQEAELQQLQGEHGESVCALCRAWRGSGTYCAGGASSVTETQPLVQTGER